MDLPARLQLLGGFQLTSANGQTVVISRRKGAALLAYLGVTLGAVMARDKLASLLWGQSEQSLARQSLRQDLSKLRRELAGGAGILRLDGQMVSLDSGHIRVDAPEFEALIAKGDTKSLTKAVSLYRGEFLAGLGTDAPDFEEWLDHTRSRFRDLALQGLVRLIKQQYDAGDVDLAAESANQALRIDSFREDIHRQLMRMYAERGMRAAALAQYRECESTLRRDLGVAPDDDTQRLHNEILSRGEARVAEAGGAALSSAATVSRQDEAPILVGFDHAIALLRQHLGQATRVGTRVVLVAGDAGAGKTALLSRFQWDLDQDQDRDHGAAAVVTARAHPAEQSMSFAIWKELLNAKSLEPAGRLDLPPSWIRRLAFLRGGTGDPLRAFDAMVELIRLRSKDAILTLVIEDVHFADEASLRLLFYVVRNLRRSPVLFIATVRPEMMVGRNVLLDILGDLERDGFVHRMTLPALEREEVEALVRLHRNKNSIATASRARLRDIWALSDGNPGVVVEAALAAGGEGAVPERVRLELASRLDGLDATAKQLVATASVIGERIELALLARAAGVDEEAALRGVEALIAAGVFTSKGEVLDFTPRRLLHAQYSSLLPARRRQIHLTVAQVIAEARIDDPTVYFTALTHHYAAAGRADDALRNNLRLAQAQMRQGAHSQAKRSFQRVLKALSAKTNNPVEMHFEMEARLGLAAINEISGEFGAALAELRAPEIWKTEISAAALRTRYLAALGRLNGVLGNDAIAQDYLRRAAGKGQVDGGGLWQPSDQILEYIHIVGGNAHASIDRMIETRSKARRHGLIADEVTISAALCLLRALGGAADTAMVEAQAAVNGANYLGDARLRAVAMHVRGVAQTWGGDTVGALKTFANAIELATASGDLPRLYSIFGYRGQTLAIAGQHAEAISDFDTALRMAEELDFGFSRPLFHAWRAGVLAEKGKPVLALSAARAALKMAVAANRPWAYSVGLRALACALAHPDVRDFASAERAIRNALVEQDAMGLEFERARSLVTYAQILQSAGETRKSRGLGRQAKELFRQMKTVINQEAARDLARVLCAPCEVSS